MKLGVAQSVNFAPARNPQFLPRRIRLSQTGQGPLLNLQFRLGVADFQLLEFDFQPAETGSAAPYFGRTK
jgi:hypothetical protein